MINLDISLHSVLVHFTVSLLVTSAALALLGTVFKAKPWSPNAIIVARWNLFLGVAATVFTVAAGFYEYWTIDHDSPSHVAMTIHRNFGLATFAGFALLALWAWRRQHEHLFSTGNFLVPLIAAAGLLGVTGYLGGELVYSYGLGVQSLPSVTGDGHDHDHDHGAGAGAGEMGAVFEPATSEPAEDHGDGDGHDDHGHGQTEGHGQTAGHGEDDHHGRETANHHDDGVSPDNSTEAAPQSPAPEDQGHSHDPAHADGHAH